MDRYQISDIEELTGIKSHTIRIWEKRYNIVEPNRTDTNIRYYSNNHVRKLLNVSLLLSAGHKISKVAKCSNVELDNLVESLKGQAKENNIADLLKNDLIKAMLNYDEVSFERYYNLGLNRFGFLENIKQVVYPFLVKTGILWSANKTAPSQEHFASALIMRKIISAIDGMSLPQTKTKSFLLFLPQNEWHEIGLLVSEYILRLKGFKTIYLGQNVPLDSLEGMLELVKPDYCFTFFVSNTNFIKLIDRLSKVRSTFKSYPLLVANGSEIPNEFLKENNIIQFKNPDALIDFIDSLKKTK